MRTRMVKFRHVRELRKEDRERSFLSGEIIIIL